MARSDPPAKGSSVTGTIVTHAPPMAVDLARRANRLFLASFGAFIGLVLVMIIGLSERQTAEDELARRLDVDLADIPPAQLAGVLRDTWNTPAYVAIAVLALISGALFSHGVRTLGRLADDRRRTLVTAATPGP